MIIYLTVSILIIIASVFIFFENIIISSASLLPMTLIGLSVLQAVIFKSQEGEKWDHRNDTAYSVREIDYNAAKLSMKYHSFAKLAIIPLLFIFIIYFNNVLKIAVSVCIYLLSFFPVGLFVKYSKKK